MSHKVTIVTGKATRLLHEVVLDVRHLDVIAVNVTTAQLKDEGTNVRWNLLLRYVLHYFAHPKCQQIEFNYKYVIHENCTELLLSYNPNIIVTF